MVVVPAPTIVTVLPLIVATFKSLDANVTAPVATDVGATKLNAASPKFLVIADIALNIAGALLTVKIAVVVPGSKLTSPTCEAVIVVVPAPMMVTVLPLIVATLVSLEDNEIAPDELLVGVLIVKLASPNVFVIEGIALNVGSVLFTTSEIVFDPERWLASVV